MNYKKFKLKLNIVRKKAYIFKKKMPFLSTRLVEAGFVWFVTFQHLNASSVL